MSVPTSGTLPAGQIFHGRYEIVRCLKAGGMGAVYECIHLKTRKRRALKVMLPQVLTVAGMRDRFELEARVTADIESEHIVETFDAGVDDATGAPFLVMELLRGEDLGSIMKKRGPLSASETVLLLSQAALALDKTHAAGIVHRDLKPDNFFVSTRDDGSPRLKVLDFGIAKVVAGAGHTVHQTAMIGTPLYMSYEQVLGEGTIGPGADIYAMGHIAFTLLTGAPYWADEQKSSPAIYTFLGKVMAGAHEPPTTRAARRGVTLPPAFDGWFAQATARAASERFDSASTQIRELAVALGVSPPRVSSLPFLPSDSRASAPSLADAEPLAGAPGPATEPLGTSGPTVSEGTTLVASSKSIGSTSKRSRALVAVVSFGAIGLLAAGLLGRAQNFNPPPATSVITAVSAPMAAASAPEPAPATTQSVAPEPASSSDIPVATATASAVELAPTATQSVALTPASPTDVPTVSASTPTPPRPKPVPAKIPASNQGCNPPYVVNSAGIRVMKSQCL